MKYPPRDFWTFGMYDEEITPAQKVEQIISNGDKWARRILAENGIDPSIDSTRANEIYDQIRACTTSARSESEWWLANALVLIVGAKYLRERFKSTDAELAYNLMVFCSMFWSGWVGEFERQLLAGCAVFDGGARGRAARPPKLTAEQKADIRQEMDAAKHGTKKSVKEDLAKKHRISVREIERIAKKQKSPLAPSVGR